MTVVNRLKYVRSFAKKAITNKLHSMTERIDWDPQGEKILTNEIMPLLIFQRYITRFYSDPRLQAPVTSAAD